MGLFCQVGVKIKMFETITQKTVSKDLANYGKLQLVIIPNS